MLLNLYRSKTPLAVFSLPVVIALLAIPILVFDNQELNFVFEWQNTTWREIYKIKFLHFILLITCVATTAHQINNLFNRNAFYSKNSFVPGFIYVLCLLTFKALVFTPMLIGHLFFVLALSQLLNIKRQDPAKAIIFWAGFFIGLGVVFAPVQASLILLPWLALVVFRPFVWREWFMVILGGVIPIIYLISVLFLTKGYVHFPEPVHIGFEVDKNVQLYEILNFSVFGLIVLGSIFNYLKVNRQEINRFKKLSLILAHFTWLSLLSFAIGWYFYDLFYLGFLIPLSIIIGTQILHSKSQPVINGIVIIWLIISVANVVLSQS